MRKCTIKFSGTRAKGFASFFENCGKTVKQGLVDRCMTVLNFAEMFIRITDQAGPSPVRDKHNKATGCNEAMT